MRRGLMKWEPAELPEASLTARTERVQAALAAAGFDALVIYTNNVRPAAVTYLTAFTPYWSDAILLLPRQGTFSIRDVVVEAGVELDPLDQSGERGREHAAAGCGVGSPTGGGQECAARRRVGVRHAAVRDFR